MKYDLATSISNLQLVSGAEVATPDHCHRKVEYGHRRQYVDCPTSARSTSVVNCGECQTDTHLSFHTESQTQRNTRDKLVQTVSKCELCNRQMQIFPTATDMQTTTQQLPCTPCPAFVQLIRGTPCCPVCRCVAGIVQGPQQSQQQQTQQQEQEQQMQGQKQETTQNQMEWDQKSYGMLTSEKASVQQVANKGVNLKHN
ncbi:uncharacterized protein LOC143149388 [Ptiloglossa arizonensis]|uniref:uncharacterized protein LOC143149388 n=1 Tax=Ptiloglossa arizonensis TaxID=3350558 RepID=UPI003FA0A8CA